MAIQGLSEYGGLYNNYRVNAIPQVTVNEVEAQQSQQGNPSSNVGSVQSQNDTSNSIHENKGSRVANLEDVSLTFNKDDTFDYIGSESEISKLDLQQAVSDMKKDQVLQQYQFFVGSNMDQIFNESEDGKVLQKLNF